MREIIGRVTAAVIALAASAVCTAQTTLDWSVDFSSIFDNREGDNEHTTPETIFFTRLRPLIGVSFGTENHVAAGVEWIEPVGYDWLGRRVRPLLYYRYSGASLSGSFGIFPRTLLHEELPGFLWSDSTAYFQPDIRGALLQWQADASFVDIYLDWRQKQTVTKRESFSIAAHGRWKSADKPWLAGAYLSMNHLALTKDAPADMHIIDNFLAAPYIGADISGVTALDSLRFRVGAAMTVERNRADGNWHTPTGAWLEVIAGWKGLRLKNILYGGGRLLPSYSTFGGELYQAEPFFDDTFYERAEVGYGIIRNSRVELRADLVFNVSPHSFIFYQKLSLSVRFGRSHHLH